jgi:hypothetical protein
VQSARKSSETKSPGRLGPGTGGFWGGCSFGPGITPHLRVETVDNFKSVETADASRFGP